MTAKRLQPEHDLPAEALESWLALNLHGFQGPISLSRFPTGQSNPTYCLKASSGSYVLRRKPFGQLLPTAHAIEREFRVTSALDAAEFPVARPLVFCADDEVIGSSFYVMEFVEGITYVNGLLPGLAEPERHSVYLTMIDCLGQLHRLNPSSVGLQDFGPVGSYLERQVSRWAQQYRSSQTELLDPMEKLLEFLPRTVPRQQVSCLVHGDYRIDNIIFERGGLKIRAVLDWELSTIGSPIADFAKFLMNWVLSTDGSAALGGADLASLGIPVFDEAVDHYAKVTGLEVRRDLEWFLAFNCFRHAAILQGVKKRALLGNASSPTALARAGKIPEFARVGWGLAQAL